MGIRQEPFQSLGASDLFVARVSRNVFEESSLGFIFTSGDPDSDLGNTLAGVDYRYLNTRLSSGSTLEGSLWYQQSDSEGIDGDDAAYGISLRVPTAEGLRYGMSYKELQENYYPALGFVNRNNVRDLTVDVGYTWYPAGGSIQRAFSGVDYQRIETLQGQLQSELVSIRALEIVNGSGDSARLPLPVDAMKCWMRRSKFRKVLSFRLANTSSTSTASMSAPDNIGDLPLKVITAAVSSYDGDISAPGADITWRPNEHFRFALGYHVSDIDLPYGAFITRLASLRADIAFTNTLYWENTVQYDNVSYGLGLNSILRWVPRAGREVILVVNREFVDYTRDRTFTSVTGDITFKFGYTFRFLSKNGVRKNGVRVHFAAKLPRNVL